MSTTSAPPSTPYPSTTTLPTQQIRIISSTKITKKVTQLLDLLFHSTPPIVELSAPSSVASKLITIVEIVKREAASRLKQPSGKHSGKLYQYCTLHAEAPKPKRTNPKKRNVGSGERDASPEVNVGEGASEARDVEPSESEEGEVRPRKKQKTAEVAAHEDDEEEDDFFETMAPMTKRLCAAAAPDVVAKSHPTPVLRIYLSRKPIESLRKICRSV